jgi:hypothetical protein
MVSRVLRCLFLIGILLQLAACDVCPETAMTEGAEGLVITAAEHPDGWGQDECWSCHAYEALHRRGCSEGVDLELVREQVEDERLDSCSDCHGDNGVTP